MQDIVKGKLLSLRGSVGIFPANSVGDDIEIYSNEGRQQVRCRFFGLRQQAEKENDLDPYLCISDFIASKASGVPDYLGLFANGTFGVEAMVEKFKADVSHSCPPPHQASYTPLLIPLNYIAH
jgi:5-methyltetrahydrofolate--homocysteine methyltransferase